MVSGTFHEALLLKAVVFYFTRSNGTGVILWRADQLTEPALRPVEGSRQRLPVLLARPPRGKVADVRSHPDFATGDEKVGVRL